MKRPIAIGISRRRLRAPADLVGRGVPRKWRWPSRWGLAQPAGPGHRRDRRQSVDHGRRRRRGPDDRRRPVQVAFSNAVARYRSAPTSPPAPPGIRTTTRACSRASRSGAWPSFWPSRAWAAASAVMLHGGDAAATAYATAADDARVPMTTAIGDADAKAAAEDRPATSPPSPGLVGRGDHGPGRDRRRRRRPPRALVIPSGIDAPAS